MVSLASPHKYSDADRFLPYSPPLPSYKLSTYPPTRSRHRRTPEMLDHEHAVAQALGFVDTDRMLKYGDPLRDGEVTNQHVGNLKQTRSIVTNVPYRILDAPGLRNDFYTNLVAWSSTGNYIVVGLGSDVFVWTEHEGSTLAIMRNVSGDVTGLSFSPNNVVAVSRNDGSLCCYDVETQRMCAVYRHRRDAIISSVAWLGIANLFVGDTSGCVTHLRIKFNFASGINTIHKGRVMKGHEQQICGGQNFFKFYFNWGGDLLTFRYQCQS
jgi:meiosis-specific APC/C activator protein AMA1